MIHSHKTKKPMTIDEFKPHYKRIEDIADADGDACLVAYFSREEDAYQVFWTNLDAGDALLIIHGLIDAYDLHPEAVLAAVTQNKKNHA